LRGKVQKSGQQKGQKQKILLFPLSHFSSVCFFLSRILFGFFFGWVKCNLNGEILCEAKKKMPGNVLKRRRRTAKEKRNRI